MSPLYLIPFLLLLALSEARKGHGMGKHEGSGMYHEGSGMMEGSGACGMDEMPSSESGMECERKCPRRHRGWHGKGGQNRHHEGSGKEEGSGNMDNYGHKGNGKGEGSGNMDMYGDESKNCTKRDCHCAHGLYRHGNGMCVRHEDCHRRHFGRTCDDVFCPFLWVCRESYIRCFREPCPESLPRCIPFWCIFFGCEVIEIDIEIGGNETTEAPEGSGGGY